MMKLTFSNFGLTMFFTCMFILVVNLFFVKSSYLNVTHLLNYLNVLSYLNVFPLNLSSHSVLFLITDLVRRNDSGDTTHTK